jgi:hypothetical protein
MADSDGSDAYTLRPRLPDTARPLHDRLREGLRRCRRQDLCQQDLMRTLLADDALTDLPEPDRLATRLFFEVLEDLARHGWQFDPGVCPGTDEEDPDGEKLCAIPPVATTGSGRDHQEVKRRLRRMLVEARDEQLQQPSVRRFVEKMERPRWHRGKQVSVQDLFADPQTFSSDLERCLDADSAELREELVRDLVDPYLQRVTDERDAFTGLRLHDVWRYCRYTWSLSQKTQPGRRMSYLVRDAARPFDPIMGIGALGSSIVQISCRDEKVGWSFEALRETNVPAAQMRALRDELDRSVAEIYRADFEEEGLLDTEAVEHPSPETLDALAPLADEKPPSDGRIDREVPLEEAARRPLFRHKRAKTLRTLLRTRMTFQHAAAEADGDGDDAQFERLLATKGGRRALKAALRSQKKRHVGSSMMNITTCGALPPYNPVLGGKLAGLLMVSPQVLADYREKYGGHASYIASRMKGAPLERRNELALLETTSLYGVGSSQYNRLRAPVAHGEVRYEEVGQTDGYGSVHLSERTYRTLQTLLEEHPDLNPESHEFGRGVNYKMRSLAAALGHLGMQKVQQHKNPRLVYAIPLATNWKAYLTGRDEEPRLLYDDLERPGAETRALVDFWKRRWFIDRVQKPAIRQRLREQHGPVRVSRHIEERDASAAPSRPSAPAAPSANGTSFMPADQTLHWTKLAELTGGGASFAEHLTDAEMAALHVPTQLDEGLLAAVEAGKRVYLTGNPGDGKTFVIRFYRERLDAEGAFLNTDASATGETDLADEASRAAYSLAA